MNLLMRLCTTNVIFGTSLVNSCIMTLDLVQILVTVGVCGFSSVPLLSSLWWPLCDGSLVFINGCLRMDFLLREQLEGQESYLARLRRGLVMVISARFILTLCVWAYNPLVTGKPLEFFILAVNVIILNVLTCVPTVSYLLQGDDLMHSRRSEVEDPLLESNARILLAEDDDAVQRSRESSNDSNYISPFPQNIAQELPLLSEAFLSDIRNGGKSALCTGIPQKLPEEKERIDIRDQQDLEYDIMVVEEHQKNEFSNQNVIEPLEVESNHPVEPDRNDLFAVEMRMIAPNGTQVTRRFDRKATLSLVLEWAKSRLKEMSISHENGVRVCDRFPRKVYDTSEHERTLESLKFWCKERQAPQRSSVLILEVV